jgi:diguanylate cyclase (GGDEF)-like protein
MHGQSPAKLIETSGVVEDAARLDALDRYDILDTPREESFDRIARLIRTIFGVKIATVALIDAHRQWNKAIEGLDATEIGLDDTFCKHAIRQDEPLVIPDTELDARFARHPLVVGEPFIRSYAGVTLRSPEGHKIGTVCAIHDQPRAFAARDVAILHDLAGVAMEQIELRAVASTDPLTGLPSRRAFREQSQRAEGLARRHRHPLAAIMLDLDHFKRINDNFGHAAGDRVLVAVAGVCEQELRKTDIVGRLGGEEFAVLLPHTTATGALDVAQKLRSEIARLKFDFGNVAAGVTASFGISELEPGSNLEGLLAQADAALYEAKDAGRNRCVVRGPTGSVPRAQRRRVLKAGRIILNNRHSTVDCTVRWLSDDGAGVDVLNAAGIPERFILAIPNDRFETNCRILTQTDRHIEVEFAT